MSRPTDDDVPGVVSARTGQRWIPVMGLEVHCQLKTKTKLFSHAPYRFGAEPNTRTTPVCTGQPGALPVLNEAAVLLAVRAALALDATVATWSKFDRKNYFYCDLPKGFQITQFDQPYCSGGGVALPSGRIVRLTRIHLEEDAGKAIHDRGPDTLVDLNRAGVPLIEIVSEADITSAQEAFDYLTRLKETLQFAGASDCDMEKGSLRCDVNISVHRPGAKWGTKVELKNLNSFRNVMAAADFEILRQIEAYESGDSALFPVQETRTFDAGSGKTRSMRSKEDAHDYRYFPEPDLPLLHLSAELIDLQRRSLPESAPARRARYVGALGLSEYDAGVLTASPALAQWFEETADLAGSPKDAANWISNEVLRALSDPQIESKSLEDLRITPSSLAELIGFVRAGKLNVPAGREVLRAMLTSGRHAAELIAELGLEQVSDEGQLEEWCQEALVGKDKVIADVLAGKDKAVGALVGPVMKASKGKANPQVVTEILLRLIRDGAPS